MEYNELADRILTDNAEELWNFVAHNKDRYEEYCKTVVNYSMAEFVKNRYFDEFMKYLDEEY